MALLLRLLFGFDVSMPLALLAGIGSRLATARLGPGFVAPDWWMAELVVSGAFKLRNGAKITINNSTKPDPQVAPNVENR